MGLTLEKYAPLAFLMGLALLIGLSMISYRSLNDLTQTADQVTHTHLVISQLEEVLSDFKDVVSGYRNYVLTGKESYLDVYSEGRRNVDLVGAWSVDLPGGRFWADDASKAMHGFEPSRTIGAIEEAGVNIHPEDRPGAAARFHEAVQNRAELECEYRVIMPDGSERWIAASGQIIQSDLDEPDSFKMFGIVRDITERKHAEAERERLLANEQEARQAAEEASRMKDEFLAVLSHELRTPLNAIVGYANLMRKGRYEPEEAPQMLDIVLRNAWTQQQLIADMLDVSRIITGKMGLNLGPVEPRLVIQSALDTARPAAEAKQITFVVEFDPSVGVITGDADRLQQAVWNLLSNAVKFTPAGGKVTVRLRRDAPYIEIAVSDTGKGIKPEYLPHVFNRFSQEDYSTTRKYGGLGLGLSIVRHVAELHGGSVRAASEGEGRGATFVIRLPMSAGLREEPRDADSHKITGQAPHEMARGGGLQLNGARVLVVDDDADTRQLLKRVLESHGAAVRTAASAAEALEMIAASPPDALVADIGMPGEDGYSLMRKIRRLPSSRGGTVPALALTAYARPEDRARALTAGFQQYVAKPVEPDDLAAVVAKLTGRLNASSHA
ncbi:MAG TPA: ATP-binding protein [Blastocatellia bacterium]|nr:ATP-binding protein [Blastocatellia bacterium]